MTIAQIDKPLAPLDSGHRDSASMALWFGSMDKGSFFGQFWKLGFCWVSEFPISTHRGWLRKLLDHEHVASVPTWNLPKHACMTYWNPFLRHGFHSMPRLGIQQVSLKACRRWDSMFHRLMTISWIDEPSAPLDSVHQNSAIVSLYSGSMDKGSFFLSILETRVFLSKWMWNFCT